MCTRSERSDLRSDSSAEYSTSTQTQTATARGGRGHSIFTLEPLNNPFGGGRRRGATRAHLNEKKTISATTQRMSDSALPATSMCDSVRALCICTSRRNNQPVFNRNRNQNPINLMCAQRKRRPGGRQRAELSSKSSLSGPVLIERKRQFGAQTNLQIVLIDALFVVLQVDVLPCAVRVARAKGRTCARMPCHTKGFIFELGNRTERGIIRVR